MNNNVIHRRILRTLNSVAPCALPEVTLAEGINCDVRPALSTKEIAARLSWLLDRGLVAKLPEELDPQSFKWLITEAGKATLASFPSA